MSNKSESIELLKSLTSIRKLIEINTDRIVELHSMLTSTTIKPKEVDVQTSAPDDKFSEVMANIVDLQRIIESQYNELYKKLLIYNKVTSKMDYDNQYILFLRYEKGYSIERCANNCGVSPKTAKEKIRMATEIFSNIYAKIRDVP